MASFVYTLLAWASLGIGSTAMAASGVSASTEVIPDAAIDGDADVRAAPARTNVARFDLDDWQQATATATAGADDDELAAAPVTGRSAVGRTVLCSAAPVAVTASAAAILTFAPKTSPPVTARS